MTFSETAAGAGFWLLAVLGPIAITISCSIPTEQDVRDVTAECRDIVRQETADIVGKVTAAAVLACGALSDRVVSAENSIVSNILTELGCVLVDEGDTERWDCASMCSQ